MTSIKQIHDQYGYNICRRCINREYRVNLTPEDCIYLSPYPKRCSVCNEMNNIVGGFSISGKLKMLFK